MGIIELSNALGLSKSTVSHLVKKGMPKTLSARLLNQPQRAIEKTLLDFVDITLAQCATAVAKVSSHRKL